MRTYKRVTDGEITVSELVRRKIRKLDYEQDVTEHVMSCNNSAIAKAELDIKKAKKHNQELKVEHQVKKQSLRSFKKGLKQELEREDYLSKGKIKKTQFINSLGVVVGTIRTKELKLWCCGEEWVRGNVRYIITGVEITDDIQKIYLKVRT